MRAAVPPTDLVHQGVAAAGDLATGLPHLAVDAGQLARGVARGLDALAQQTGVAAETCVLAGDPDALPEVLAPLGRTARRRRDEQQQGQQNHQPPHGSTLLAGSLSRHYVNS